MTPAYERNGAPVAREDFYRIACDPQRHVVVEACAGAGKTWMLVSRILRALLEGTAPQEILAITFTKKAAGEMRQRLMEWLEDFAQADDERLRKELLMRGVDAARAARPGSMAPPARRSTPPPGTWWSPTPTLSPGASRRRRRRAWRTAPGARAR